MAASPPRRRSLRLELLAALTIVLMMAVVSLSLLGEVLGRQRHDAAMRRQLEQHARGLASLIGSAPTLEPTLRGALGTLGIESVAVYREVAPGSGMEAILELGLPTALAPPVIEAIADGESPRAREGVVVVDEVIRSFGPGARRLVLRLVARPSAWTRRDDWPEILLLATGVGLVLLVLGAGLLELQVIRPLAEVRRAFDRVAAGDLEARAPADGPAEIAALSEGFNRMTAALESQRRHLVRSEHLASLGRIAAGTAHEVGNPLAAMLGYVELLLDPRTRPELAPEQRDLLERCRAQIERIQALVGQLLDYSRPPRSEIQDLAVGEAARRMLALLRHDPRCQGVDLVTLGDTDLRARADPGRLDQILQNLVVNGARAAREGAPPPRVRVHVHADERGVVLDVQDSGPGVPTDVRPHLFEPFFTTAPAGEGTGLGLAICQGLVESMDGTLECLPHGTLPPLDPDGSPGAVFRVILPRAPGH